ncbi:protein-serine O-palmitoleoyltransferase porcupine [Stomoxys calcitrans]|uniref:Protein-serine O-palmitoleoyltransferase porcupine n=1 Tax=Stomoxys calcitrans TaxID=35570 RepID=A0A1I8NMV3_STOCA|nr:protein-serine O-palmitoleoyltransferase porcupine [Stomoxys calcitrans]
MDYYYYDEPENDLEHQAEDYEYDADLVGEESFSDLCKGCIAQTSYQIQQYIIILLSCGLVHVILWEATKRVREVNVLYHLISILCGLLSLWLYVGSSSTVYVLIHIFNICFFLRLVLAININHKGLWACIYTIGCQLLSEIALGEEKFESIRGPLMLVSMKLISVAFDIQDERENFHWSSTLGYLCSPSSLILGPWIPFRTYRDKNKIGSKRWKILKIILYVISSVVFLNLSNCILPWLKQLWNGGLWYRIYLDALAVRCSHYFISYLSHATLLVNCWPPSFHIVKPLEIEFPRSLSTAIRNWNIPMHLWLKSSVFHRVRSSQGRRSHFIAIITTYLVSCLVHGFNYKVHLVLVSLGLFSYFENNLRRTLAQVFNACIEAYPCRGNCKYKHCTRGHSLMSWHSKRQVVMVRLVNFMFSFIAIVQLAYLGIMLNSSNPSSSFIDHLLVWSHMNFFGHWLACAMAIFYVAI